MNTPSQQRLGPPFGGVERQMGSPGQLQQVMLHDIRALQGGCIICQAQSNEYEEQICVACLSRGEKDSVVKSVGKDLHPAAT